MEESTSTDAVARMDAYLERIARDAYATWEIRVRVEVPEGALTHALVQLVNKLKQEHKRR